MSGGYFFNGRLWITPSVMSVVDDSAMLNTNQNVGNTLCLIGASTGGEPNTPLAFGSAAAAAAALGSGDLVDGCRAAFHPSDEVGGPATVICIRVNPALQSSLVLLDSTGQPAIDLTSADWGNYTNQIKVKVESGTTVGAKVTTSLGSSINYVQDNIARNAFTIQYSGGQASANMSITPTAITLAAPTGTTVATVNLNTYPTVQQVVDYINTIPGFAAAVSGSNGATAALNGLDGVTTQDVKTAVYTATANLQAIIDYLNSPAQGLVTATRPGAAIKVPVNLPYTYLSGGSDGTITNTQWQNAFTTLQNVDVQWVVPLSGSASIAAMADAHVQYMSTVGRMERRAITGMTTGTTDAQAIAAALAINSDRTSLVHLGYYDYNSAGVLTLYQPYILAAMIGGAFAGVNPGTPLTNKELAVQGMERPLQNPTETDPLILGGVLCVESTNKGYFVVQSISTWLVNNNYNRVEQSTGAALDFAVRSVRQALTALKGAKGSPQTIGQALSITDTTLRGLSVPDPAGPGVLVGDAKSPPYKGIAVALQGDVLAVSFQCSPVIPVNYIPVTVYATPYSGSASAAS